MGISVVNNVAPAKQEDNFSNWTRFHIQVRDASTIYLATNRKALEVPGPGGLQGGIAITAALNIVSLNWIGPLFIIGSNPQSTYDIETFPDVTPC